MPVAKQSKSLYRFFYRLIRGLFLLFTFTFFLFSIPGHVHIDLEFVTKEYRTNGAVYFLLLAAAVLLLPAIRRILDRVSERTLFLVLAVLYTAAGLYLLFGVSDQLNSDPAMIYMYMPRFAGGDFKGFSDGWYFAYNPNLAGFAMFELMLYRICDSVRFLYAVFLVMVLLIEFLQWRICVFLFPEKGRRKIRSEIHEGKKCI